MEITIYGIGGRCSIGSSTGDCLIGKAYDTQTFLSLISLVELKGGYAVSMHGTFGTNSNLPFISGEYSLNDARNLVQILEKTA